MRVALYSYYDEPATQARYKSHLYETAIMLTNLLFNKHTNSYFYLFVEYFHITIRYVITIQ